MMLRFVCVALLLVTVGCAPMNAPSTLKFVNLVYRHGARSPIRTMPKNDIPIEMWYQKSHGWLTQVGMRMHYDLGKFIRNRYDGFLSREFLHSEMKIWSSDVYRTYQSAYSNLHGMYDPPTGDNVWAPKRPEENWQPIPVMTIGLKAEDRYIRMTENCPNKDRLIMENYNSPAILQAMADNTALFDYVYNNTGLRMTVQNFWEVTDAFDCQAAQGIPLPAWASQSLYDKLKAIDNQQFGLLFAGPQLKRLRGGPLLKLMVNNMKSKISGHFVTGSKMRIYSAHDTTVGAVLTAMDLYNDMQPTFASSIFIELHQDGAGDFVKVFYKNDTTAAAMMDFTHKIPGCETRCTFAQFESEMADGMPTDWQSECVNKQPTDPEHIVG